MGDEVAKVATPWGTPWNHREIIVNLDLILRDTGIEEPHVRRRMIAHAAIASGWRQSCQNFNVWKVKRGGWAGNWYVSSTKEEVAGKLVVEHGTKWRSYASYQEAVADYPPFHMDRYRAAFAVLRDASANDGDYWAALGKAGYYTDTHVVKPHNFEALCRRVRRTLASSPELEAFTWSQYFKLWLDGTIASGVGA